MCLTNTRVNLLALVASWIENHDAECLFWLSGMAGTGKSTVARTVAKTSAEDNCLGGSFFFSRGRGNRSGARVLFTTLAAQLAEISPLRSSLRQYICEAIAEDGDINDQSLRDQFQKLILHPVSRVMNEIIWPYPLISVVDALDECDSQKEIRDILYVLRAAKDDLQKLKLRFFITSRPDHPIDRFFNVDAVDIRRSLDIQTVPEDDVKSDISTFIKEELSRIREENGLASGWPGEEAINTLVERANPLFIYAATACRFIENSTFDPDWSLKEVLKEDTTGMGPLSQLYQMYVQI